MTPAEVEHRGVLLVEERGAVRVVTFNRPDALNAANEELHGALAGVWTRLAADEEMRALVITGAGRAFSGGGDLDLLDRMVHDADLRAAIMEEGALIVRGMASIGVPIIAAVNGPAVGLGCSLAGLSDIVLIEEGAYFSDPHVALGLVAGDGGAMTWPLLTSLLVAKEHILLGDRVSAEDAVRMGVANRVVPAGAALDEALVLAERIAQLPPQSVRETKRLLNAGLHAAIAGVLDAAITTETQSFDEAAFQANLARMRSRT
jgi:enoyl-CoA hydratase